MYWKVGDEALAEQADTKLQAYRWDPQDETKYYGITDRKYRKNNWPLEGPFWNAIIKKNQNASSIQTASEEDELVKEFDSVEEAKAFVEQELLAK